MSVLFRRLVLALTVVVEGSSTAHSPGGLPLLTARDGGALRITAGPHGAALASVITVEQREGSQWRDEGEIAAIDRCGEIEAEAGDAPVRLAPAQVLNVVPWRGWTCEAQCPRLCGVNIYLGPGSFRFVATLSPRGERVASNSFTMPDRNAAH